MGGAVHDDTVCCSDKAEKSVFKGMVETRAQPHVQHEVESIRMGKGCFIVLLFWDDNPTGFVQSSGKRLVNDQSRQTNLLDLHFNQSNNFLESEN